MRNMHLKHDCPSTPSQYGQWQGIMGAVIQHLLEGYRLGGHVWTWYFLTIILAREILQTIMDCGLHQTMKIALFTETSVYCGYLSEKMCF